MEELQAAGKEGGQDAKDETTPARGPVEASDVGGQEDPPAATGRWAEEGTGQVSERETQPASASPTGTEGDPSQDGPDQETRDAEAAKADSDQNGREAEQSTPEETPSDSNAPEATGNPPGEDPSKGADAGEDAAILEELLSDSEGPDTGSPGEEAGRPTAPTAETTEESAAEQEPPPSRPSGDNETSGDEATHTNEVLHLTGGEGLDEETKDDADARAYEELVTGELDTGPEEDEEILNLEEPAETQEGESSEETDGDGQPALTATEESPGETDPTDAFDTGSVQTAGGLSDEERGDLDKLITGLKEASPEGISPAVMKGLQKQLKVTDQRVAKLGKMVLAYDRKLKACYEVMRLHHEKTEIMNRRIDALVAAMNNGKNT